MASFSLGLSIMNYLQTSLRMFRKNRGYSLLNIIGLAVGLACSGLIFLWVEDELNFDSNQLKKDQIYLVNVNEANASGILTHSSTPGPLAAALPGMIPGVVSTCRVWDAAAVLFRFDDKAVNATGIYADHSIFDLFTVPFVQGNAKSAFRQMYSIVLTESAARKFFGDVKDCLGKTVTMDNKQAYVVTGVVKDQPENSSLQFEWLAPMEALIAERPYLKNWGNFSLSTYIEMRPGANIAAINKMLADSLYDFTTQKRESSTSTDHIFLFSMQDWRLRNQFENGQMTGGGRIQYVRLFSAIAWIVLFIACINFMNLATARSEKRSREVGVRKVLGAGRSSLVRYFLGESILMAALAAIASVVLMWLALPAFDSLAGKELKLDVLKPVHLTALVVLTLVCGMVSGSYPALYLSAFNPVFVLKGIRIRTGGATLIRRGLVVLQFTVSIVLIIGTMVIYLQVQHVKNRALGFNKDRLLQMNVQGNMLAEFPAIKQELLNTGVISNAALADHPTLTGGNNTTAIDWPGKEPNSSIVVSQRVVSPEYISTLGMRLAEGRDLESTDVIDPAILAKAKDSAITFHVVVTKTMERLLGAGSAIGKTLQFNANFGVLHMIVKGVVDDYVYGDMYGQPAPVIFFCMPKAANLLYVRMTPQADPEQALAKMAGVFRNICPGVPFEYTFVDDQFNALFQSESLISKLSRVFAFLAIFISCVGLFGLAAYTAESRVKEIGIRKVLGASTEGVTYLLTSDFLKLTLVSCVAAFPVAAWVMYSWLQGYSYRIGLSWWVFAVAGALAVTIAAVTVSLQAVRAAMANPVRALRSE
ncbi:MAG TPA: ABC transporter permease [Puia sp.]|nr:ABC transporter permease [Puia sp.]